MSGVSMPASHSFLTSSTFRSSSYRRASSSIESIWLCWSCPSIRYPLGYQVPHQPALSHECHPGFQCIGVTQQVQNVNLTFLPHDEPQVRVLQQRDEVAGHSLLPLHAACVSLALGATLALVAQPIMTIQLVGSNGEVYAWRRAPMVVSKSTTAQLA